MVYSVESRIRMFHDIERKVRRRWWFGG